MPTFVNEAGARLLLHAALGGPSRQLAALERAADSGITTLVADSARSSARVSILARAASLAFPNGPMAALTDSLLRTDLLFAQRQWQRGAKGDTRAVLRNLRNSRRAIQAANVQFDYLLPEARLIEMAEGVKEASEWLDPTLNAIRTGSHMNLVNPVRAASLVGAMTLRADLGSRYGDRATAKLWATAVAELWAECDPALCPIRDRMRALTR